jgi:hypothetical protein
VTEDQAAHAEHVAHSALSALGTEPAMLAECIAVMICGALHPHAAEGDVDARALRLLNDVVVRVNAHTAAATAIVNAMTAARRRPQ